MLKRTSFCNPLDKSLQELGLNLGTNDCLSIINFPVGIFSIPVHHLGEAYLLTKPNDRVFLKTKEVSNLIGVSQITTVLDVGSSLTVENDLLPALFVSYTVKDEHHPKFDEALVTAVIKTGEVIAAINSKKAAVKI